MGVCVKATSRPLYLWQRPGSYYMGGWVSSMTFWTGAENLASTGNRSSDRLARNELPHNLRGVVGRGENQLILQNIETRPHLYPTSCSIDTGFLVGVKAAGT